MCNVSETSVCRRWFFQNQDIFYLCDQLARRKWHGDFQTDFQKFNPIFVIFAVRDTGHSWQTSSASWLLIFLLLMSPCHQEPWWWMKNGSHLYSLMKIFHYLSHFRVIEWCTTKIYVYVSSEQLFLHVLIWPLQLFSARKFSYFYGCCRCCCAPNNLR